MHKLLILCDAVRAAPALAKMVAEWRTATGGAAELWCSADVDAAACASAAAAMAADLGQQAVGSLAARAWVAACLRIATGDVPILILESAGLDLAMLRAAEAALVDHEMVFVPAPDGAVALIGLRRAVPELFAGAPADLSAASLRTRAKGCGVSFRELPATSVT